MQQQNDDNSPIIPPHLLKEIYYYIVHLSGRVTFKEFAKSSAYPVHFFGKPNTTLRKAVTTRVYNILRRIDYHLSTNNTLSSISALDAPYAASFHESLLRAYSSSSSPNRQTMSFAASSSDSEQSSPEPERFGANVQSPPFSPFSDSSNRRNSNSNHDNGMVGGGKLVVASKPNALRAFCDMAAHIDFSYGIPAEVDDKSFYNMVKKLNDVTFYDPKDHQALPTGVDIFQVLECPDANDVYMHTKIVIVLQVSFMESLKSISARLSPDGRVVIVSYPYKER